MKAEQFNLISEEVRNNLIARILTIPCDSKVSVTIANIGSKSKRQQGLDWKWDGEIFKSGIGWHDDSVDTTHARSKWLFARPVLLRDSELFQAIHDHFIAMYGKDQKKCIEFARDYISTQSMTVSQASEYMNNKQMYWIDKGVNLTEPSMYGLDYK